jgi:flagellar biosynthesis component FlhA
MPEEAQPKQRSSVMNWLKVFEGLDKLPWGTIFGGLIVLIVAVVGGIVAAAYPGTLAFDDYVSSLGELAVGVGLVTVGRGVTKAAKHASGDNVSR